MGQNPIQHGEGWQREKVWHERSGVRYISQRPTEVVGGRVLPSGMKTEGEREGDGCPKSNSRTATSSRSPER